MKKIISIILVLISANCIAQNDTLFFPEYKMKATGQYSEGKKQGEWKWFWQDGSQQSEGNYNNDIPIGEWTNWHHDGRLKVIVNYDTMGRKHGKFTEYYYEIPETHELEFENGKLNGLAVWRHFDGNVLIQGRYTDNQRTGEWKWFWPNGKPQAVGTMVDSTYHGKWTYYHEDGSKDNEGNFEKGEKTGLWKFYWKASGIEKKNGYFENDLMSKTWQYFDEKGSLIREEKYIGGIKE